MEIRGLLFFAPMVCIALAAARADEPAKAPSSRVVGRVYGKPVTASDIGLTEPIDPALEFDARDTARWELMGRIMTAFGGPVVEHFVKSQKIEASAQEIEKVNRTFRKKRQENIREWESQLAELQKKLAAPDLSKEDREKLTEEKKMYERFLAAAREGGEADLPDDFARGVIIAWKTERELQRAFGGRVIFQQAGPEALDARRRLFEQAEKNGDLVLEDPGVRHMFYYYANMKHTVIDEQALEKPWFFGDGE
jgi:hypothetical protein